MIAELIGAKWHGSREAIGAYINAIAAEQPQRRRAKISKEHNYKFTHRKAVTVSGGVWRVKTESV